MVAEVSIVEPLELFLSSNNSTGMNAMDLHPYYPKNIVILNFLPNTKPALELVSTIGIAFSLVIGVCYIVLIRYGTHLSQSERWTATWFVFCGLLHLIFEGVSVWSKVLERVLIYAASFVFNFKDLASGQGIFPQLWKEYALCDSRYLTREPGVLVLEALSVVSNYVELSLHALLTLMA